MEKVDIEEEMVPKHKPGQGRQCFWMAAAILLGTLYHLHCKRTSVILTHVNSYVSANLYAEEVLLFTLYAKG